MLRLYTEPRREVAHDEVNIVDERSAAGGSASRAELDAIALAK